jgi:hypothetical protein
VGTRDAVGYSKVNDVLKNCYSAVKLCKQSGVPPRARRVCHPLRFRFPETPAFFIEAFLEALPLGLVAET